MNRTNDIRTPRKKTMITKNTKKTKVLGEKILTMKSIRKKTINTNAPRKRIMTTKNTKKRITSL
jgi:hypothetical protein